MDEHDSTTPAADEPVRSIRALDRAIQDLGLTIWIGGEPTFTDRFAETEEWLQSALGGEKEWRARRLLARFLPSVPGAVVLRTVGRQYPGEAMPRWNLGWYERRNGTPAWTGPPDPLVLSGKRGSEPDLAGFARHLTQAMEAAGWRCRQVAAGRHPPIRLAFRIDNKEPADEDTASARWVRASIHHGPLPESGLRDDLAAKGDYLLVLERSGDGWARVELPGITDTGLFLQVLGHVAAAANAAELGGLILRGYPPPVDRHVRWSSLTPDPAVIEANLAPAATLEEFFTANKALFEAAGAEGLAPYRLQYNGRETDSGGGGQLTVGAATPEASPFFLEPKLLPRLVRYFNHHPALSYWFAPDYVGSGSQAPRPDEGLRERFLELDLALDQVTRRSFPDPAFTWDSLAPFLADAVGNSHRSELNIEKLWNPYLGDRGRLGLVEFRPFRMAPEPGRLCALAALLRNLVARLMQHPFDEPLMDWGDRLHDRFALPFVLRADLVEVLQDLETRHLGLGPWFSANLLDDSHWRLGQLDWQGTRVRVRRALEFWPLIGDASTQQPADSRLVDASTTRVELTLEGPDPGFMAAWELRVEGRSVPMTLEAGAPVTRLMGIRYRSFKPWRGLHPALPARDRVELVLTHPALEQALSLTLFDWHPEGAAYPGLPATREEAAQRRAERLVAREIPKDTLAAARAAPQCGMHPYCFDLRRM